MTAAPALRKNFTLPQRKSSAAMPKRRNLMYKPLREMPRIRAAERRLPPDSRRARSNVSFSCTDKSPPRTIRPVPEQFGARRIFEGRRDSSMTSASAAIWIMRSSVFSTPRTLPGQEYARRRSYTPSVSRGVVLLRERANLLRKQPHRSSISPSRSRSGGTFRVKTFRR